MRGAAGPVYGAEATLGITRGLALVGNVAYASSDLEVGLPVVGGLSFGKSSALLYDAALRLSLPLTGAGSAGSAPSCRRARARCGRRSKSPPSRPSPPTSRTTSGAGVDVPLGSRLGLQLMAKDYIGKFDAREATALNVDTEDDAQLDAQRRRSAGPLVTRCDLAIRRRVGDHAGYRSPHSPTLPSDREPSRPRPVACLPRRGGQANHPLGPSS